MASATVNRLSPSAAAYLRPGVKVIDTHLFGLYGGGGGKHMETLQAFCYTCDATVEVYGVWSGELTLIEPPDADVPDHHDHDLTIEGVS